MIAAAALALALTAPAAAADAAAPAATASATAPTPEVKKPEPLPLHATAGITSSMGSATYVLSPANPTLQSQLSLGGSAKIDSQWSLNVSERIGFEWTHSDGNTYDHQLELADPRFGVGYSPFSFKDLGLAVSFSGGYSLPISMTSRSLGSLGGLGVGARATWTAPMLEGFGAYAALSGGYTPQVGALAARYAAGAGKAFTATNGVVTPTLNCVDGARPGDPENFACGSIARARVALGVGASYSINEQLSVAGDLSAGLALQEYIAPTTGTTTGSDGTVYNNADLVGANAREGLQPGANTSASLSLSWSPTAWFTLTGGTSSAQPMYTGPKNNILRFPLWDFVSPANNFSSFFVDTTFSI